MIHQIGPNFFFVERGWLNANHFIFNGKKKVLIDTGYHTGFEETWKWVESIGVDLRAVELIVSTHSHCDHVGGNKRIQEISGCEIAIHPTDKQSIESKNDWATWYRFYDQEADFFTPSMVLEEDQRIFLDDLELKVIHTPGHARGGISLYSPEWRFLISSDALWEGDTGVLNTIVEGREAPCLALGSLEKISTLSMDTVYPGHGKIIHDPKGAIRKCRLRLEAFLANPVKLGQDHLKKIMIWVLLMKKGYSQNDFFKYLMTTPWYKAVVDLYFEGRYQEKFSEVMKEFLERNIVFTKDNFYLTTVQP